MDSFSGGQVDGLSISNFESLDSYVIIVPAKKNNGLHIQPDAGGTLKLDISAIPCFGSLSNCELSLALWVRLDGTNTNNVMFIAGEAFVLRIRNTNGNNCPCKVAFEMSGKSDETNLFDLNGWNHLTLTWSSTSSTSGTAVYYQDGSMHHSRAASGGIPGQSSIDRDHIKFKSDAVGITVDDLYLWSIKLEDEDVQALYDTY